MLSTQMAIWNYLVILSHQCSTIDSLDTYPPYAIFPSGFLQLLGQLTKVGEVAKEKFLGKCDRLAWNCLKDPPIMTLICNKGILEFESDLHSNEHYLSSRENRAWKKFRLLWDFYPWPLQHQSSALPTELTSQLGAGHYVGS